MVCACKTYLFHLFLHVFHLFDFVIVLLPKTSSSSLTLSKKDLPSVCHCIQHWPPFEEQRMPPPDTPLLASVVLPQWVSISDWISAEYGFLSWKCIWKLTFPFHISLSQIVSYKYQEPEPSNQSYVKCLLLNVITQLFLDETTLK